MKILDTFAIAGMSLFLAVAIKCAIDGNAKLAGGALVAAIIFLVAGSDRGRNSPFR